MDRCKFYLLMFHVSLKFYIHIGWRLCFSIATPAMKYANIFILERRPCFSFACTRFFSFISIYGCEMNTQFQQPLRFHGKLCNRFVPAKYAAADNVSVKTWYLWTFEVYEHIPICPTQSFFSHILLSASSLAFL